MLYVTETGISSGHVALIACVHIYLVSGFVQSCIREKSNFPELIYLIHSNLCGTSFHELALTRVCG